MDNQDELKAIKFAQGMGPVIRIANELRAVKGIQGPFLPSSRLHEDLLKGNLGAGSTNLFESFEGRETRPIGSPF